MERARLATLIAGVALLGAVVAAGLVLGGTRGALGSAVPTVSVPAREIDVVEGNAGTSTVMVTATLSTASSTPVTVAYTTANGTAKSTDGDFVAKKGTLTFPAGVVRQSIPVLVNGDTKLEDTELFQVDLSKPVGATLKHAKQKIEILNDELPAITIGAISVKPGRPANFTARPAQRYSFGLTLGVRTINGTARSPADFAAIDTAITIPAGSRAPVKVRVATSPNSTAEPAETFSIEVSTPVVVLGTGTATIKAGRTTTTTTTRTRPNRGACPSGSTITTAPIPGPTSPSSPATLAPPDGVTAGAQWDMMFDDEFDRAAVTASKWSTGMRSGAQTLEGNGELQWYQPANSVVTTDNDGFGQIGVLRQTLQQQTVPSEHYTVRTLSRIYPPSKCAAFYDPSVSNSTASSNTNLTDVPYRFTSGMLNSSKSFGFKYGYVEARVKMPKGFGLWPAMWLRDWRGWNYEIDAFEGFDRSARVFRTTHWWGNGSNHSTENDGGDIGLSSGGSPCRQHIPVPATSSGAASCSLTNGIDLSAGYHTIGLNWTATKYELYFDGVKRWTSPAGASIAKYYSHLILNLAFGNNGFEFDWAKEAVKPFDPNLFSSTMFPKRTIEWDYVRVWQPANAHDTCAPASCS